MAMLDFIAILAAGFTRTEQEELAGLGWAHLDVPNPSSWDDICTVRARTWLSWSANRSARQGRK